MRICIYIKLAHTYRRARETRNAKVQYKCSTERLKAARQAAEKWNAGARVPAAPFQKPQIKPHLR
jgi:hypothetical protein